MSAQKEKIVIDFLKPLPPPTPQAGRKGGLASKISPIKKKLATTYSTGISNVLKTEERAEGMIEVSKQMFKERHAEDQKLNSLIGKSSKVLARMRNIIPIFTDEIVIDTHKVTVINRPFFFSEHIQAVSIKNINDVFIKTVPLIASNSIMDVGLPKSHIIHIKWFWKKDAEKARRIITGLMEVAKENVDLKNLDEENLVNKLEDLGRVRGAHTTVSGA
jgi:hypothetical protein